MPTKKQHNKAINLLKATNALKEQGLIDDSTEQAIMATLPIITDTRGDVESNTQLDAQEFADGLSVLTGARRSWQSQN